MTKSFACRQWQAWAPGLSDQNAWLEWARSAPAIADEGTAPVKAMPALLRRRAARLGRAALEALYALHPSPVPQPIIFCSRHGEIGRSLALLQELAREGTVSPQEFGMAVHNAVAGLYSIAQHNHAPITALAAENTLTLAGLLEAIGELVEEDAVTLVYCDEPLPALFKPYIREEPFCVAIALDVCRGQQFQLHCEATPAASNEDVPASESILPFVRFLLSPAQNSLPLSPDHRWSLQRLQ